MLVLISSLLLTQPLLFQTSILSVNAQTNNMTTVAVKPSSITGLNYQPGQSVTFDLNVTNAPAINGFAVSFVYNNTILQAQSIDYSGTVLGSKANAVQECIDGRSQFFGGTCTINVGGSVELSLLLLGTTTTPPTTGLLFKTTFIVIAKGLSQIHLVRAVLVDFTTVVPTVAVDGYFTNTDCGPQLCTPPIADFSVSPSTPVVGQPIMFNASSSKASNSGATIRDYSWDWGDGAVEQKTTSATTTHVYLFPISFGVTLRVTDSYGTSGYKTVIINVFRILIDLAVTRLVIAPTLNVLPGTLVNITAQVENLGSQVENATLRIGLENNTLASKEFPKMPPASVGTFFARWNTTRYSPGVYQVEASVDPVRDATTGQVIENNTSNNITIGYVQLVEIVPPPDFRLTANPSTVTIEPGSSGSSSIVLTSLNHFVGFVTLSTSVSPEGSPRSNCFQSLGSNHPPKVTTLNETSVRLAANGTATISLTISQTGFINCLGALTVIVTGSSGPLSHTTNITITFALPRRELDL